MLIRALILLLAVLNLGVAAWWIFHPSAPAPVVSDVPGVAQLELVDQELADQALADEAVFPAAETGLPAPPLAADPAAADALPQAVAVAPAPSPARADAPVLRCLRLGPYADAGAARLAINRLGGRVVRSHARQVSSGTASWSVFLAPLPDPDSARAMAARIQAAGLGDFFVISEGERANGIALGRYRNRDGALRRQAEVRAAGFDAQLVGAGADGADWWIEVAAADGSATQLAALARARQSQALDCATVR